MRGHQADVARPLSPVVPFWQYGRMTKTSMTIAALLTGRPVLFRGQDYSAIAKQSVHGPVRIGWLGLENDAQADPVHHGGRDKAIHLYPQDHYPFWRENRPGHALLDAPGAFGENIASRGLVEADMCIGDRFTLGSAVVEVSHGRQPCWKLDHRFGEKGVMATIVKTARCGIYFRVIREGEAQAGTQMLLIDRLQPQWTVDRVFRLLIGGEAKRDPAGVKALAGMVPLADAWRQRAAQLAGEG